MRAVGLDERAFMGNLWRELPSIERHTRESPNGHTNISHILKCLVSEMPLDFETSRVAMWFGTLSSTLPEECEDYPTATRNPGYLKLPDRPVRGAETQGSDFCHIYRGLYRVDPHIEHSLEDFQVLQLRLAPAEMETAKNGTLT